MKWELYVPDRARAGLPAKVTVAAENWKAALVAGLRQLAESQGGGASYSCDVREDGTVRVVDLGAKREFVLRDLDYEPAPPIAPPPAAVQAARSLVPPAPRPVPSVVPPRPAPSAAPSRAQSPQGGMPISVPPPVESLPEHQLFFSRNEEPESGSSLWYRERLIAVPTGSTREGINVLLMTYYNQMRAEAAARTEAKYINIAVFDHVFTSRAERPALGALNWKSWRSEVPEVSYPVDQPAMPLPVVAPALPQPGPPLPTRASAVPPVPAPRAPSAPPPPPAPAPTSARGSQPPAGSVQQSMPSSTATAQAKAALSQTGRRRVPTPADLLKLGREGAEEMIVNEILAQVFEEMMGLFNCRTREGAAEFALDVAMRRIPCEAGSVLLSDINSRDLVFTAVRGDMGHRLKGRKIPMGKGIVGFAARQGVAIAIADVRKDSRFTDDLDKETGFATRSVIVAPIVHDGQTYGAFELLNRRGAEVFLQTETSIISYIAQQLGEHLSTAVPSGGPDYFPDEEMRGRPPARALRAPAQTKKRAPVVSATATVPATASGGKKR